MLHPVLVSLTSLSLPPFSLLPQKRSGKRRYSVPSSENTWTRRLELSFKAGDKVGVAETEAPPFHSIPACLQLQAFSRAMTHSSTLCWMGQWSTCKVALDICVHLWILTRFLVTLFSNYMFQDMIFCASLQNKCVLVLPFQSLVYKIVLS